MKTTALTALALLPILACSRAPSPSPAPAPSAVSSTTSAPTPSATTASTVSESTPDALLQASLTKVVEGFDGTVAITVLHLTDKTRASLNGDRRLPMMSVFKLPLGLVALSMVEDGTLKLEQDVPIAESELRLSFSPIADAWKTGTHSVTLETLIVRSIQDSDNTGGDKLVTLEGGGAAITARLRKLKIEGVDIAEQEIEIFARTACPGTPAPKGGWTFPAVKACPEASPAAHLAAGQYEIDHSPNGATTDGLVGMLAAIEGDALPRYGERLREIMAGTKTGAKRLKALLPEGTRVEHKTGTGDDPGGLNVATNDVGVIVLPDGKRVAIAVLTAGSRQPLEAREALIGRLAKATWDRFVK